MTQKTNVKRDRWVVRDDFGLLHNALIARYFNSNDELCTLQVATACHPRMEQIENLNTHGAYWSGSVLPSVTLTNNGSHRFQIIEYHVREVPTCLQCIAHTGLE